MSKCYKCGTETGRYARLDENGNLNKYAVFVPVCNDCGPKYTVIVKLTEDGIRSLTVKDINDLKGMGSVVIPELN